MKLKYYLRGLGTGIIFTAIILTIVYSYKTTDHKVMERAKELGMVMKDDNTEDNLGTQEPDTTTKQQSEAQSDTTTEPQSITQADTTTKEPQSDVQPDTTTEPQSETQPDTTTKEPQTEAEPDTTTKEPQTEAEPDTTVELSNGKVSFTISKGMTSETVSAKLQELGIIEDAKDYNKYLIENGYSNRVRAGVYEISKGSTYEQITDILVKK